jgi:tetratricopeptide (TPR) repeat protein
MKRSKTFHKKLNIRLTGGVDLEMIDLSASNLSASNLSESNLSESKEISIECTDARWNKEEGVVYYTIHYLYKGQSITILRRWSELIKFDMAWYSIDYRESSDPGVFTSSDPASRIVIKRKQYKPKPSSTRRHTLANPLRWLDIMYIQDRVTQLHKYLQVLAEWLNYMTVNGYDFIGNVFKKDMSSYDQGIKKFFELNDNDTKEFDSSLRVVAEAMEIAKYKKIGTDFMEDGLYANAATTFGVARDLDPSDDELTALVVAADEKAAAAAAATNKSRYDKMTPAQREREVLDQKADAADLKVQGNARMADGDYTNAATIFAFAMELDPSDELTALKQAADEKAAEPWRPKSR